MVNPGMAINMAVSGFGFYGMLGLAVPQFCYKLLFRGGGKAGWPGSKKNENLPEDGDVVHEQALRWMGFVAVYDLINTARLTDGFKNHRKTLLENQAGLWLAATLMHLPAQKNGAHPKAVCFTNYVSFPITALVCWLASKKC